MIDGEFNIMSDRKNENKKWEIRPFPQSIFMQLPRS